MAAQKVATSISVAIGDTTQTMTITRPVGLTVCEWVQLIAPRWMNRLPELVCEIVIGGSPRTVFTRKAWSEARLSLASLLEPVVGADPVQVKLTMSWSIPADVAGDIDALARFS